jgi:hypothetical protein
MRFVLFVVVFVLIVFAGCRERSVLPPEKESTPSFIAPNGATMPDPHPILDRMVAAYQSALSYSDKATLQIIGKMSLPGTEPAPWNCVVALQKPNRLRLEVCEGIFVSDGEDCFAQIRMLPNQVLHFSAPENWTLETLFQDVHLDSAMELAGLPLSVLRFPPQLVLLFANNPLNTFCPKGAKIEWLAQEQIGQIPCDVIQISHSDGNRILWISQEDSALLRLDYQPVGLPVPEGFESIEAIRIEMTDAQFGSGFGHETFQMYQPQDAVKVARFQSDTPGLPTPEEHHRRLKLMTDSDTYRLIDQHIAPSDHSPPPKVVPRTFALSKVWSLPLDGVGTMALLPGETPQLLVPCEGNRVARVNLQGKVLDNILPKGLEDSIIMNVRCNSLSEKRRIGMITLDGKFHLFDESFNPIVASDLETDKNKTEIIRDFYFVPYGGEELLLLAIQQDSEQENAAKNCIVRAVDLQGTKMWERFFKGVGIPSRISSAVMVNQFCVLVACTTTQDSIVVLPLDEESEFSVAVPFGRQVAWFHVSGSTIYSLWIYTETGDVRFVGLDEQGKPKWSRLLPAGEYEVEPVYVESEQKWFVPSPNGDISVFDQIGNLIETFSLAIIPTGLVSVELGGATLLIVADGETVSAWRIGKVQGTSQ